MLFFRIMGLCLAVEGIAAFLWWQNNGLMVSRLEIRSPRLPDALDGFTIAQVADLHNKSFGVKQSCLLGMIQQAAPRIIVSTGDLIDKRRTTGEDLSPALDLLAGAAAIAPTYFVAGNHEGTVPFYPLLRQKGEEAGAVCLDGRLVWIEEGGGRLALLGMPSPRLYQGDGERFARELGRLRREAGDGYTILLSHHPELHRLYGQERLDLVLSGHAHGGQFRLPLVGGLFAPGQGIFPRYTSGLYALEGGGELAVSRGLGNSRFPLRLFNRPQLLVVTLRREGGGAGCFPGNQLS